MSRTFLIVDSDAFVAEDLTEIIRETVAGAHVIHASLMDGHMMQVIADMSVDGVFLPGDGRGEEMQHVARNLRTRRVGLVWTGEGERRGFIEAGTPPPREATPFTVETVRSVLLGWEASQAADGGPG